MRILLVFSDPIVYRQHLREITASFVDVGWHVTLATRSPDQLIVNSACCSSLLSLYELPITRNPSPLSDISAVFSLFRLIFFNRFDFVLSFTPKGGFISSLTSILLSLSLNRRYRYIHYFTGPRWTALSPLSPICILLKCFDKLITLSANRLLCDSFTQRDLLRSNLFLPSSRRDCLGDGSLHGVDT